MPVTLVCRNRFSFVSSDIGQCSPCDCIVSALQKKSSMNDVGLVILIAFGTKSCYLTFLTLELELCVW
jgi:hypothetical protein